jgi:hypothetical protein
MDFYRFSGFKILAVFAERIEYGEVNGLAISALFLGLSVAVNNATVQKPATSYISLIVEYPLNRLKP